MSECKILKLSSGIYKYLGVFVSGLIIDVQKSCGV